ncbi:hypothetical protein GJ496_005020 [Pomphorhynchus laevis]|nr:hypothetical protein GJ496_005020 [Pomphorhynchus laevis]
MSKRYDHYGYRQYMLDSQLLIKPEQIYGYLRYKCLTLCSHIPFLSRWFALRQRIGISATMLKLIDKNKDSQISYEEMRRTLSEMGHTDAQIEKIFQRYDINHDMTLNYFEQQKLIRDLEEAKLRFKNKQRFEDQRKHDAKEIRSLLQSFIRQSIASQSEGIKVVDSVNKLKEHISILNEKYETIYHKLIVNQ